MSKLFSPVTNFVFIANYGLCSVAFIFFLNWTDTGRWASDGWSFMLGAGLVCGVLALVLELSLFRKVEHRQIPLVLFLGRQIAYGIVFLALSFALSNSVTMMVYLPPSQRNLGNLLPFFLTSPFMAIFYLPLIAPFGVVAGLLNGILFRITDSSQVHESVSELS
jgi:hypothetical protein